MSNDRRNIPVWELVDENGKNVAIGTHLTSFRGESYTLLNVHPPRHAASTGHVTVKAFEDAENDWTDYLYAKVFGLKFKRVDRDYFREVLSGVEE